MASTAVKTFERIDEQSPLFKDEQGVLWEQDDAFSYLKGLEADLNVNTDTPPVFMGLNLFNVQNQKLAEMMNVTPVSISNWKRGVTPFVFVQITTLCTILHHLIAATKKNLEGIEVSSDPANTLQRFVLQRRIEEAEYYLDAQKKAIPGLMEEKRKLKLLKREKKHGADKAKA
jgi:transcriptional regulator with XRE-family HTH domain